MFIQLKLRSQVDRTIWLKYWEFNSFNNNMTMWSVIKHNDSADICHTKMLFFSRNSHLTTTTTKLNENIKRNNVTKLKYMYVCNTWNRSHCAIEKKKERAKQKNTHRSYRCTINHFTIGEFNFYSLLSFSLSILTFARSYIRLLVDFDRTIVDVVIVVAVEYVMLCYVFFSISFFMWIE